MTSVRSPSGRGGKYARGNMELAYGWIRGNNFLSPKKAVIHGKGGKAGEKVTVAKKS